MRYGKAAKIKRSNAWQLVVQKQLSHSTQKNVMSPVNCSCGYTYASEPRLGDRHRSHNRSCAAISPDRVNSSHRRHLLRGALEPSAADRISVGGDVVGLHLQAAMIGGEVPVPRHCGASTWQSRSITSKKVLLAMSRTRAGVCWLTNPCSPHKCNSAITPYLSQLNESKRCGDSVPDRFQVTSVLRARMRASQPFEVEAVQCPAQP